MKNFHEKCVENCKNFKSFSIFYQKINIEREIMKLMNFRRLMDWASEFNIDFGQNIEEYGWIFNVRGNLKQEENKIS